MRYISWILTLAVVSTLLSAWTIDKGIPELDGTQNIAEARLAGDRAATDSRAFLTMILPERNGQQFTKVSFSHLDIDQIGTIQFDFERIEAFRGTPAARGQAIAIKDAWVDETGTFWVEFDSAVATRTPLTLALRVQAASGEQEFGIAAYPEAGAAVFVSNERLLISH